MSRVIRDETDLLNLYGVENVDELQRRVYNDTMAGVQLDVLSNKVFLSAIVEGSDAEVGYELQYPFHASEISATLTEIEYETDALWEELHCEPT